MKKIISLGLIVLFLVSCKKESKDVNRETTQKTSEKQTSTEKESKMPFELTPIQHATFVMQWGDEVVYVDPVGGLQAFEGLPAPSLVLITDIHGDHFNVKTLSQLDQAYDIVAPKAVYEQMTENLQSKTKILDNGKSFKFHGFDIEAIPMYNITEGRQNFHVKGRGNGYVMSQNDYKVYISGDTEDIPEMRNLENIDLAFICMNLPYTMTPDAAAEATLEFKPQKVLPYHYRGKKDEETHYFDVEKFKRIINTQNNEIEVELLEWYPSS